MFETKKKRRERLMRTPLRPKWLAIVERNVPYYRLLPHEDRGELGGLIQAFLAEKRFEGCAGFEITDEIRLTPFSNAAQSWAPVTVRLRTVLPNGRTL